ncbi:MAG: LPS assembly protein LptD [Pseudomonadota bacterium]
MRWGFLVLLLWALPTQSAAQDPAVLIADQVFIAADRVLVAQGNVEVIQGQSQLTARSIRYDQSTGALSIEGPIRLTDGEETLILADAAELDEDLRNGLLYGARVILAQQLQIAAQRIDRVDARFNQLSRATATSCRICDNGRAPLWQIRARRVIHDQIEKQLYFDEAQFRILDVPVFYLPRLRLPGPGLDRATGFLVPSIRTTSLLGTGLKIPYFIRLGRSRDLTITPYFSSATRTIELRYRQAFSRGRMQFSGALTRDDQQVDGTRGYVIGVGAFSLPRDYQLTFDVEAVSDIAYFPEYDYSDKDRLTSQVTVSRARRDAFIRGSLYHFESLREEDINDNLPTLVFDADYERRFFPARVGGELRLRLQAHAHQRNATLDIDGPDEDDVVDGRDVARIHGEAKWLRRFISDVGIIADVQSSLSFNFFNILQDATFEQSQSEFLARTAVALRYPMMRQNAGGATHMLEPVMQVAWASGEALDVPNEESSRVEFDEGNLLSLSRFPRPDRQERGRVLAVGLNWARFDPAGWDAYATLGQVYREKSNPAFSVSSGLSGTASHFLIAGQVRTPIGLAVSGRSLIDENFNIAKAEVRGDYGFSRGHIGGRYVWLNSDELEDRDQAISEIFFDGSYDIDKHWRVRADWRYNVADDRAASAGFGVSYDNECVSINLSVSRRYSSSTSVEPTTDFGFNVGLRGFAARSGAETYTRSCKR